MAPNNHQLTAPTADCAMLASALTPLQVEEASGIKLSGACPRTELHMP